MPIEPHPFDPDGPDCRKCPLPQGHRVHVRADGPAAAAAPAAAALKPVGDLGVQVSPSAPQTSQAAALTAWPKAGTQRGAILEDVAAAGERGCTDDELVAALNLSANTVRPRRGELVDGGWLVQDRNDDGTPRTRPSAQGNPAAVWVLTAAARARFDRHLHLV